MLRVSVWRQPELSLDSVIVRPDGRISVPLLDDVQVTGKTPEELKGEITSRLGEFVREPSVTVVVLESRSRLVYVQGEVARKGVIPLTPGMRVSDALAISGDLGPFANTGRIRVLRENGSRYAEFMFDYKLQRADEPARSDRALALVPAAALRQLHERGEPAAHRRSGCLDLGTPVFSCPGSGVAAVTPDSSQPVCLVRGSSTVDTSLLRLGAELSWRWTRGFVTFLSFDFRDQETDGIQGGRDRNTSRVRLGFRYAYDYEVF